MLELARLGVHIAVRTVRLIPLPEHDTLLPAPMTTLGAVVIRSTFVIGTDLDLRQSGRGGGTAKDAVVGRSSAVLVDVVVKATVFIILNHQMLVESTRIQRGLEVLDQGFVLSDELLGLIGVLDLEVAVELVPCDVEVRTSGTGMQKLKIGVCRQLSLAVEDEIQGLLWVLGMVNLDVVVENGLVGEDGKAARTLTRIVARLDTNTFAGSDDFRRQ